MIILYKAGNTHKVRGITCEAKRFNVGELKHALSLGYVTNPEEIKAKADTNKSGKLSSKEVREAAKQAGIENYTKKKIATLKKELGYED